MQKPSPRRTISPEKIRLDQQRGLCPGERRARHGGQPHHRPVLGPGRGRRHRDRRQIRPLLPVHRPKPSGDPPGRRGVRQRHLARRLAVHAAPAPGQAPGLAGPGGPQPLPGPLAAGPRRKAGWGDPPPAGRAGGVPPLPPDGGSRPGGGRPHRRHRRLAGAAPQGRPGALPPPVLVRGAPEGPGGLGGDGSGQAGPEDVPPPPVPEDRPGSPTSPTHGSKRPCRPGRSRRTGGPGRPSSPWPPVWPLRPSSGPGTTASWATGGARAGAARGRSICPTPAPSSPCPPWGTRT